jgi:hypothetical protein
MPIATKTIPPLTEQEQVRFWKKVNQHGPIAVGMDSPCWDWKASVQRRGYGQFKLSNGVFRSHRISWFLINGQLPVNLFLCHRCDRPICCNPDHLFAGTNLDNMRDAWSKGRYARGDRHGAVLHPESCPRGENRPFSKLNSDFVREIRLRRASGEGNNFLAREFGVSSSIVSELVRFKSWRHVL